MRKVLYVMTSPSHKRAIEPFCKYDGLDQLIAAPDCVDKSNFSLRVKTYSNSKELQKIVDSFKPDIYAQASLPCPGKIKIPIGCKKVYISHGLVGNHVKGLIKPAGFNTSAWEGCDLYCGAWGDVFVDWITHVAKVSKDKILLNALPQLDILHRGVDRYRETRLKNDFVKEYPINKDVKIVLFFGFCCKDRVDFTKHNKDYFETAVKLQEMTYKDRLFLLYIKPRQERKKLNNYFQRCGDLQELQKKYDITYKKNRVHYIGPRPNHILDYYFADVFVTNGCSTAEIEACALGKPLFVVRTKQNSQSQPKYDPYNTVTYGAATEIISMSDLEAKINEYLREGRHHNPDMQEKLINDMGIKFDGQMHKRIQDRLISI